MLSNVGPSCRRPVGGTKRDRDRSHPRSSTVRVARGSTRHRGGIMYELRTRRDSSVSLDRERVNGQRNRNLRVRIRNYARNRPYRKGRVKTVRGPSNRERNRRRSGRGKDCRRNASLRLAICRSVRTLRVNVRDQRAEGRVNVRHYGGRANVNGCRIVTRTVRASVNREANLFCRS